ncbi:hypothetical protein D3C84_1231400 [compost metagenome]
MQGDLLVVERLQLLMALFQLLKDLIPADRLASQQHGVGYMVLSLQGDAYHS